MLQTKHLILFPDTGFVFRKQADGDHEYIGHIDNKDACPFEFQEEWDWLVREMEDRRHFYAAIERTVVASYYEAVGTPHWN